MTKEARDDFTRLVLRGIHPTQKVTDLADRIAERMTEINQGRLWMGAHMRRGDCRCSCYVSCLVRDLTGPSRKIGLGNGKLALAAPRSPQTLSKGGSYYSSKIECGQYYDIRRTGRRDR